MNLLFHLMIDDRTFCRQDRLVGVHYAVIAGVSNTALEKKSTGKKYFKIFRLLYKDRGDFTCVWSAVYMGFLFASIVYTQLLFVSLYHPFCWIVYIFQNELITETEPLTTLQETQPATIK